MADSSQDVSDNAHATRTAPTSTDSECICGSSQLPPGLDSSIRWGNPHYGRRMQLYCRTGYHLAIKEDTSVHGIDEDMNDFAIMEFTSVDFGGLVRIRGVNSNLYLAMNKKGRLYGEPNPEDEETIFIEGIFGQYNTYMSHKYKKYKWYVGIKKTGKQKPGHKTRLGQKAVQFLPRRIKE